MTAICNLAAIVVVCSRARDVWAYREIQREGVVTLEASRQRLLSPRTRYTSNGEGSSCWLAGGCWRKERTPRCPPPRVIYRRAGLRFCCSMRLGSDQ